MSFLRITAGDLKGRRIRVPSGPVRPTSERARQAFFNIVSDRIEGARFLDLFAGSGVFSFEALSRGAASAVAVDASRRNAAAIEATAKEFGSPIEVMTGDVLAAIKRLGGREFDLVYADPPYEWEHYDELLMALDQGPIASGGLAALEHRRHSLPFTSEPQNLTLWRRAEYGEVWISMFVRN